MSNPQTSTRHEVLKLLRALRDRLDGIAEVKEDRKLLTLVADEFEHLTSVADAVNGARTVDFIDAVKAEAAHQRDRWGRDHDAGKRVEDWITLFTYLLGKLAKAYWSRDTGKVLHHVVTVAAVALNMHANLTGADTRMRPGVGEAGG